MTITELRAEFKKDTGKYSPVHPSHKSDIMITDFASSDEYIVWIEAKVLNLEKQVSDQEKTIHALKVELMGGLYH